MRNKTSERQLNGKKCMGLNSTSEGLENPEFNSRFITARHLPWCWTRLIQYIHLSLDHIFIRPILILSSHLCSIPRRISSHQAFRLWFYKRVPISKVSEVQHVVVGYKLEYNNIRILRSILMSTTFISARYILREFLYWQCLKKYVSLQESKRLKYPGYRKAGSLRQHV